MPDRHPTDRVTTDHVTPVGHPDHLDHLDRPLEGQGVLPAPLDHLGELKEFARLHARNQGIGARATARVLARIGTDAPDAADSWTRAWRLRGDELADRGRLLAACRHYTLARFPYPYDDPRRHAQQTAVATFDTWRRTHGGIERLELPHPDGTLHAWAAGLDTHRRSHRPLLLMMGGIVSVKEQWAPLLPRLTKLGYAAVVAELPGVGENTQRYTADSWRLIPWLLDRLSPRARTDTATLLSLSFGGHMALRAAAEDPRVRRLLTVGPPVAGFFTDPTWWERVPGITKDTLRRLTGARDEPELCSQLRGFALTEDQLRSVGAAVRCVTSARDEIIPPSDTDLLRTAVPDLRVKVIDDVHGSPGHPGAVRRWLAWNLRGAGR
ncbi:alpha/beta fold hydrolase [Streptomyces phaeochromogenes]|uniref:alpha/beta fold hydrolase n=1 Tax=Streptomyces phaeochromogenes TaxID=1923 RepID=UPI0033D803C8